MTTFILSWRPILLLATKRLSKGGEANGLRDGGEGAVKTSVSNPYAPGELLIMIPVGFMWPFVVGQLSELRR